MKNAACIALFALAIGACSKNDTTQTPTDVEATPGTAAPSGGMPTGETPASTDTMGASANGSVNGAPVGAGVAPADGSSAPGSTTAGAPGSGSTGSTETFAPKNKSTGPTAANGIAPGPSRPDADNTRVNERDRGSSTTPMDQGNNDSDLKITQKIRQAVMGDGGLSFTAKNVKIITNKGTVVLRGPVKSDDERSRIDAAAKSVAGAGNVVNEIEVKK